MVNKPLIRPYLLGWGVALGGAARIPLTLGMEIQKPNIFTDTVQGGLPTS